MLAHLLSKKWVESGQYDWLNLSARALGSMAGKKFRKLHLVVHRFRMSFGKKKKNNCDNHNGHDSADTENFGNRPISRPPLVAYKFNILNT